MLDFNLRIATVDGDQVTLNINEWDLLQSLMQQPGAVIAYSRLKQKAWGDTVVTDAAVHMAIRRLHKKLNCSNRKVCLIRDHRGIGYSLAIP